MDYVADTVAFVRFVTGSKKIGKTALDLMLSANEIGTSRIILPAAALMEIMYLAEKGRIPLELEDTLDKLEKHPSFSVLPLDENIVRSANSCRGLELHDRLIVATAKYLNAPLLTCDKEIINSNIVKTIWA